MRERARSAEDKAKRSNDLLEAAERLAVERGGVRFVTVAAVTDQAGLHRTGVRRYFANKEELLLQLAERGWQQWRDSILARTGVAGTLLPDQVAALLADTITVLPVFCDLLAHVAMNLEGDVDIERARRYKLAATAAHDELAAALERSSTLELVHVQLLVAGTVTLAAGLWQTAHPTDTLRTLYDQVPEWGHAALDFAPRLQLLLTALANGLPTALQDLGPVAHTKEAL